MADKIRVLVNAIPLLNVGTGIARYLKCLYTRMESLYGDRLEIRYFNGINVVSAMPCGPENLDKWSKAVDFFWKLPAYPALLLRLGMHYKREFFFYQCVKKFDIYHEAGFFPFSVPSCIKTVFTLHDVSIMRFAECHPLERVLYFRLFLRRRCKTVDRFLTVSKFTKKEMEKLLDIESERISVTYNAHDPALFYPRQKSDIAEFLTDNGIPEKYFLFVGSGDSRKNMDIIPMALEKAGLKEPLVTAGWSGWSDKMLWSNVIPLGYISDKELSCLYSGALALILPSSYEGFGLPLLEAMACGCPVITSKEASLPEVTQDAALYIEEPRSIKSLAEGLKSFALMPDFSRQYIKKGLKQAEKFSWTRTAQLTFKTFEKVLEQ